MPVKKQQKQQTKKAAPAAASKKKNSGNEWNRVDLSEYELEGFDDGNAFELEELTDYVLEDDGFGGRVLKYVLAASGKPSKKKSKTALKKAAKDASNDDEDNADITMTAKDMDDYEPPKKKQPVQETKGKKEKAQETPKEAPKAKAKETKETPKAKTKEAKETPKAEPATKETVDAATTNDESTSGKKKRKRSKKNKNAEATPDAATNEANDDDIADTPTEAADHDVPVLREWAKFKLHPTLNASLTRLSFEAPTRIQALTLVPALIDHRDVVGAAPTGSGKTLAFGMPVLQHLLSDATSLKKCRALILTPTRELAIQIVDHLQAMIPNKRAVGIVALVGGMAVQKQIRQLSYAPEIVVATPGRLWEMMEAGETTHFDALHQDLRFLIVDEADRMLQQGSFPQLQQIFERVNKGKVVMAPKEDNEDEDDDDDDSNGQVPPAEASLVMLDDVLKAHGKQVDDDDEIEAKETPKTPKFVRQTFLFSATMTLKNAGRYQTKKMKNPTALTMLETIMKRIGLRGKPAVVDLSAKESKADGDDDDNVKGAKSAAAGAPRGTEVTLPEGLELAQVECLDEHRNNVLYYFLTQYPGRTIVFLNAISGVRKLAGVLSLLRLPVFALHAEMQQKQRLKKLEGFRANEKGILIATDVAARGLDIPSVEYVVHYHIPRSAETFVHRSGRTARAAQHGLSVSLVAPVDAKYHAQICSVLHRPSGFSLFPVDHKFLPVIKERVKLAEQIFASENNDSKQKSEATWYHQMAEAADLPFDEDMIEALGPLTKDKNKTQGKRVELHHMLLEPLRPIGSKRKFRQLHEEINNRTISRDGEYNVRDASADLMHKSKKHSLKRFRKR
ncbi:Aste57867_1631 [Aphanomyces stellatus]|uniref:ATP-dependent RNA helicase n=1 Tax=Aphanomyces stellatus TaxID=120398 RepID=A0A485K8B1_9STRA|nr:hypothetical protein As57867_001629 [Aphanomyces stellatus]VFT78844.1 Aste57867_1631 [Aphanomyces stellatus]